MSDFAQWTTEQLKATADALERKDDKLRGAVGQRWLTITIEIRKREENERPTR